MAEHGVVPPAPTRIRMVVATLIVIALIAIVWKVIDYRMQPPPPPHKIGERVKLK
jgi:hypothetical protein